MASTTAAAFVRALKTELVSRFTGHATLSAVRVDLIPTGDTSSIDAVTLIRAPVTGQQAPVAFANMRSDGYVIPGRINTYATGSDADVAFQASWDRASLILDELILLLRTVQPLTGDQSRKALVTNIEYEAMVRDQGGWVTKCDYTIEYGSIVA